VDSYRGGSLEYIRGALGHAQITTDAKQLITIVAFLMRPASVSHGMRREVVDIRTGPGGGPLYIYALEEQLLSQGRRRPNAGASTR